MLKILAVITMVATLLSVAPSLRVQAMMPAEESVIVYDNDVVETIETQLKDLPLEQIRVKSDLILNKSIADIQSEIAADKLTYTELTAFYLDRILRYDKAPKGINAVVSINPDAISRAKELDAGRVEGINSPLTGIPVLLKDNINTRDMPTSGGTYAFKDFYPAENAPMVDRLTSAGAIILGKSNLSEMAYFFGERVPSGYSSAVGQTHNPFNPLLLSPQGSSSGSGAAVAAGLCAAAFGTETTGSIVAPANIHSLVGYKPSLGLISTEGVIPLSSTMDTVGPMAATVSDAVALFNASVSNDAKKITLQENAADLKGKRIGVFETEGSDRLVEALNKAGAETVKLPIEVDILDTEFIMLQDFKTDFAAYAEKYNAPVKSLEDLVTFNKEDLARRAKYGQDLLELAADITDPDREKVNKMVSAMKEYIQQLMETHELDVFAFMNNDVCDIPCAAGAPEITVPLGKNEYDEPVGATFFAAVGQDEKLVNVAYAFEKVAGDRQIPERYMEVVEK